MKELKEVIVSFKFDPETEVISDLTCVVDGIEKKKKTTKKVKEVLVEGEVASLKLEPNKLIFNGKAVKLMDLNPEDRIIIEYRKDEKKVLIPIIGKDVDFNAVGNGNKVTKSFTVTYRGAANKVLAEYGEEFSIEEYSDNLYKLVSISGGSVNVASEPLEVLIEKAQKVEPVLIVENTEEPVELDETLNLDNFKFTL